MAALLRRQPAVRCILLASAPWQWEALRHGLNTLSDGIDAASQQQSAAPAALPPQPRHQQQWRRLPDVLSEERAPALALRRHMQEALDRRDFGTVLQLLHESEGISSGGSSSAGGVEAAGSLAPPAASWHPYDRAALYDCALWACAQRADPDEARRLVDRMWQQQVRQMGGALLGCRSSCARGARGIRSTHVAARSYPVLRCGRGRCARLALARQLPARLLP